MTFFALLRSIYKMAAPLYSVIELMVDVNWIMKIYGENGNQISKLRHVKKS